VNPSVYWFVLLVRVSDVEAWDWAQPWWNNLMEKEKVAAQEEAGA